MLPLTIRGDRTSPSERMFSSSYWNSSSVNAGIWDWNSESMINSNLFFLIGKISFQKFIGSSAVIPAWISCPLPAASSGSPTWGSSPGIPCRRSCGFQGSMKVCRKHITIKQVFLGRIRSGFEGENRTWEVRFLWTALDRAYHKIARFFRKWYFRFLPSKPEVIVPVLCNIEWINADFHPRKFAYSVSAETCSQRNFVRNIGFWRSPTIVFEVGFVKSNSKIARWYQLALPAAIANSKTSWAKK